MTSSLRHIPLMVTMVAAALGGSVVGRAQVPPSTPDTLSLLLLEVRGLRAAIEQLVSAGPRVQLAIGRLQLQEQRISEVTRRLDDVKNALAKLQKESDSEEDEAKMLEESIPRMTDPKRQEELEAALKHLKLAARDRGPELLRLQGEQAALMQDLANEQTRAAELNQRLDELERTLRK